ncbi:hypothetical protein [Singulisphaera sp. GP187]|uniref:hypothetical protein n=1 Tax=Singulisphaera sp. GP187 TaxID=1882752 RepID=UPI0011614668|nr:hypothetical protein [Singulisphaera sp. GP187]
MMRRGATPVSLLRMVIARHHPENVTGWELMNYLTEAFALPLDKASLVHGWKSNGSGELSDARVNVLLLPAILRTAGAWDADARETGEVGRWYPPLLEPPAASVLERDSHFGISENGWNQLAESDRQTFRAMGEWSKQMLIAAESLAALAEHLQRRIAELEVGPQT